MPSEPQELRRTTDGAAEPDPALDLRATSTQSEASLEGNGRDSKAGRPSAKSLLGNDELKARAWIDMPEAAA